MIENYDVDMAQLENEITVIEARLGLLSEELTQRRQEVGVQLSAGIEKELRHLGMDKAQFHIVVTPQDKYTDYGADRLEMLFSANIGEKEKPLEKVASGGELSRIALAIKSIIAARDPSGASMVFDEIRGSAEERRRWSLSALPLYLITSRFFALHIYPKSLVWPTNISIFPKRSKKVRQ